MMTTRLTTLATPWLTGLTRDSVLNANCTAHTAQWKQLDTQAAKAKLSRGTQGRSSATRHGPLCRQRHTGVQICLLHTAFAGPQHLPESRP